MSKVIELDNVMKKCNDITIVSIDTLAIEKGYIYGILGKNGAGKTTLFKLITGLKEVTSGTISVFGSVQNSADKSYLKKIGMCIDTPRFYQHLSAFDNLKMHLEYMNAESCIQQIDSVMKLVGLEPTNKLPVSKYSLGMKQRLSIARAISHKPDILLLDEPMNGLDPMGIKEIKTLLLHLLQEKQMTILMSSHVISDIVQLVNHVIIMQNGTVHWNKSMEDLKQKFKENIELNIIKTMEGNI